MNNEMSDVASSPAFKTATETLCHGLEDSMFKLLNFQAQQGANENSTMIMLALMNLLGIVNCMNKILPEGQRVKGTGELANQIAGALGGMPANSQGEAAPPGGIDPGMIAALAGMLGGPGRTDEGGEANGRPGLDPAMLATLAGMLGGFGGGGNNPAALMGMLANMLGPKKPLEKKPEQGVKVKPEKAEDKPNQTKEGQRKETGPNPRGMLKWDSRFGSPSSSF
ncbi:hypothetical protein [Desulfotomaculum sp. 1211_IL3151]|uniref:hypothetical protein n=1 Tax=Desulfotomaculum sp. 1211_IL3151 TaxID=3084055 RepID=UPI002FDAD364